MERSDGSLVRLVTVFVVIGVLSTGIALYAVFGLGPRAESVVVRSAPLAAGTGTRAVVELPTPRWIWSASADGNDATTRIERSIELDAVPTRATLIGVPGAR